MLKMSWTPLDVWMEERDEYSPRQVETVARIRAADQLAKPLRHDRTEWIRSAFDDEPTAGPLASRPDCDAASD
jgi:hypothetical protein